MLAPFPSELPGWLPRVLLLRCCCHYRRLAWISAQLFLTCLFESTVCTTDVHRWEMFASVMSFAKFAKILYCEHFHAYGMPYIKPVHPYLIPRGAEVRAIWHINRTSVLHMIYQVLVMLRLTVYGENSPVSAAVWRRAFLHTILKLPWWHHNHVTCTQNDFSNIHASFAYDICE